MNDEIDEIVIDEAEPVAHARRIRVYKGTDDDFFLDLPENTRLTFGYFNPVAAGKNMGGYDDRHGAVREMRTTCLRIYRGKGTTDQLAAFLGISGFRDETIKLTKLVRKVTIEQRLTDDGEGTVEYGGKRQAELTARIEDEDVSF